MVADIRVREGVGRVTPCAPSSQRKQSFAPLATFVRRAEDCPPYQRNVGRVTAWPERSRKGARRSVCYRCKTNPRGGSV